MSDAATTAPQDPQEPPRPRRFLRSRDDKVLGGVCGGLAKYFNIDTTLVRIATVALMFIGGAGLIAYAAVLVFVPEDDGTGNPAPRDGSRAATIAGAVLLVVAGLAVLDGPHWWWWGGTAPAIVLLGVIAFVVYRNLRDRGDGQPTAQRVISMTLLVVAGVAAAFLAAIASAWAVAAGGGAVVAAIVVALGVAMIAGAFRRRLRWLAIPALVLAIPAGVVAAADIDLDGGIGQRTYHPVSASDIPAKGYELGVGELKVDLRDLDWQQARRVPVRVDVGVGHALVLVPRDVCVRSSADVGMGYVGVLGRDDGGIDVNVDEGTTRPVTAPQLVLDAKLGMGAVEVRHDESNWDGPGSHDGNRDSIASDLARMGCAGRA
jgi:phage shock protein PspC (stress-responsive transcriptional regulator)